MLDRQVAPRCRDLSEYRAGASAVVEQLVGADRERVLGAQLPRVAVGGSARTRQSWSARVEERACLVMAQEISQP